VYSVEGSGQVLGSAHFTSSARDGAAVQCGQVGQRGSDRRRNGEHSPQTDEDLHRLAFQSLLQFHGIVASVEDEQGNVPFLLKRAAHKRFHLLGGNLIGVLPR
jgi:hypothetical protein